MVNVLSKKMREQDEAVELLLDLYIMKGDTLYTVLEHVSRSGMMRRIHVYVIKNDVPLWINHHIGDLGLYKRHKGTGALIVRGCGSDTGKDITYSVARILFGDCYALNHRWL